MYGQLTNLQKPEVAEEYMIPYVITSLQQNQEVAKFIWKDKVTAHPHFSPPNTMSSRRFQPRWQGMAVTSSPSFGQVPLFPLLVMSEAACCNAGVVQSSVGKNGWFVHCVSVTLSPGRIYVK